MDAVPTLRDAARCEAGQVGGKAATLGRLAAAGFPVPAGFVVTAAAFELPGDELAAAIAAAAEALGEGPYAVRSSAVAEDLADASYAGLYTTVLNVSRNALLDAVDRCRRSAAAARVAAYAAYQGRHRAAAATPGMAVLVQRMVPAEAAGVALSADPLIGDRETTVVTAVRGLGDRLVDGQATGDEWRLHGGRLECRRSTEGAIHAGQARAVAELAHRVAALAGRPQDVEWAWSDGRVWLLQARPMTALPEPVSWDPPGPGVWLRSFRLGEWLPEPMTPLFADWLLPRLAAGFADGMRIATDAAPEFPHAVVHGWYYATPHPSVTLRRLAREVVRSRGRLPRFVFHALVQVNRHPDVADRALLGRLYQHWREQLLPGYRSAVATGEAAVEDADRECNIALVDELARTAGVQLSSLAVVGGSAWKMEACLARFARRHLGGMLPDGVVVLLRSLPDAGTTPPPHAVLSLDWYHPTLGELDGTAEEKPERRERRAERLAAERHAAEHACRAALVGRPRLGARFEALLQVAQRYALIREEQARCLTLAWPLLRRAAHRLGKELCAAGAITNPDDVFFLTRAELDTPPPSGTVECRRAEWQRQRALPAPLQLGHAPWLVDVVMNRLGVTHPAPNAPDGAIVGQPASPGRATGPVRVLHTPDAGTIPAGAVLVAPATTPAWTPLFAHAAAVVTDGGTLAAHASLVAREYGVPAVVGTGDATRRLSDGQLVTVDGTTGVVTPAAQHG